MKGIAVVECSSLKLSTTNVKLDTVQTSICLGIGGKLLETLKQLIEEWYAPYTVNCEWEQEYEYSVRFRTRIRHLRRMEANLNCSYVWNFITRGAGMVV